MTDIIQDLLPCPFCGGEAEQGSYPTGFWKVGCYNPDCIAERPRTSGYTESDSIAAWNTRTNHYVPKLTEADALRIIKDVAMKAEGVILIETAGKIIEALAAGGMRFKEK